MSDTEFWDRWDYTHFNELLIIHFQFFPRWPAVPSY